MILISHGFIRSGSWLCSWCLELEAETALMSDPPPLFFRENRPCALLNSSKSRTQLPATPDHGRTARQSDATIQQYLNPHPSSSSSFTVLPIARPRDNSLSLGSWFCLLACLLACGSSNSFPLHVASARILHRDKGSPRPSTPPGFTNILRQSDHDIESTPLYARGKQKGLVINACAVADYLLPHRTFCDTAFHCCLGP